VPFSVAHWWDSQPHPTTPWCGEGELEGFGEGVEKVSIILVQRLPFC
jgi:hypothetical protein